MKIWRHGDVGGSLRRTGDLFKTQLRDIKYAIDKFSLPFPTIETNTVEPDCEDKERCYSLYFYHPDHLGSSTYLTDESSIPRQFLLYLPFGEAMIDQKAGGYDSRYKYTGKENDEETGLSYYGARYYDPSIGIFHGVDAWADKYPSWSPYVYTMNNPIKFTDPTGNGVEDWYEDIDGNKRFNKDLNSVNAISLLKKGESWLGSTHTETTKNGTNNYRADGSINFGSQKDGISYMEWATFKDGDKGGKQKEQFAFIKGNKMLVTPDGLNTASESKPWESGYTFGDGTYYDPITKKNRLFDSTVHTHPAEPNHGNTPSGEDVQTAKKFYPSKIGFVLGLGNGKVYGYDGVQAYDLGIKVNQIIRGSVKFPKNVK